MDYTYVDNLTGVNDISQGQADRRLSMQLTSAPLLGEESSPTIPFGVPTGSSMICDTYNLDFHQSKVPLSFK